MGVLRGLRSKTKTRAGGPDLWSVTPEGGSAAGFGMPGNPLRSSESVGRKGKAGGDGNSREARGCRRWEVGLAGKDQVMAGMLPLPSLSLPLSLCPSSCRAGGVLGPGVSGGRGTRSPQRPCGLAWGTGGGTWGTGAPPVCKDSISACSREPRATSRDCLLFFPSCVCAKPVTLERGVLLIPETGSVARGTEA